MIASRLPRFTGINLGTSPRRCFGKEIGRCRIHKYSAQSDESSTSQPLSTGTIVRTPTSEIRWGSFVSQLPVLELAAKEAIHEIFAAIGEDSKPEVGMSCSATGLKNTFFPMHDPSTGGSVSAMQLAIVFASSALGDEFDQVVPLLRELVPSLKSIVGCSVGSHL